MFTIEGNSNEYTVDLNQSTNNQYTLSLSSVKDNDGKPIPYGVVRQSTGSITVTYRNKDSISFQCDLERIKKEEFVVLRNYLKERFVVKFLPNIEESKEKVYRFKIGKYSTEGNTVTLSVISKENGKYWPWDIMQDGFPLKYDIHKTQNKLVLSLRTSLADTFVSRIVLTQQKSLKRLIVTLRHVDSNSVAVDDIKEVG